jgi:hypothetical protein
MAMRGEKKGSYTKQSMIPGYFHFVFQISPDYQRVSYNPFTPPQTNAGFSRKTIYEWWMSILL